MLYPAKPNSGQIVGIDVFRFLGHHVHSLSRDFKSRSQEFAEGGAGREPGATAVYEAVSWVREVCHALDAVEGRAGSGEVCGVDVGGGRRVMQLGYLGLMGVF